jgi:exosortase/archaeosortase family protein
MGKNIKKHYARLILFTGLLLALYSFSLSFFHILLGGPTAESNEFSMLFPPIAIAFILNFLNPPPPKKPTLKSMIPSLSLLLISFLTMAWSYFEIWHQQETFFFIPFTIAYFGLTCGLTTLIYPKKFLSKHRKFLQGLIALFALFLILGLILEYNWILISASIIHILGTSISFFIPELVVMPEYAHMSLRNYQSFIGPSCTGASAILMFLFGYGSLGWYFHLSKRLKSAHYVIWGVIGVVILNITNVLRIAGLLLIGAYYSQELAYDLFHNVAGMIFFLALILFYLRIIVKSISLPR